MHVPKSRTLEPVPEPRLDSLPQSSCKCSRYRPTMCHMHASLPPDAAPPRGCKITVSCAPHAIREHHHNYLMGVKQHTASAQLLPKTLCYGNGAVISVFLTFLHKRKYWFFCGFDYISLSNYSLKLLVWFLPCVV